MTSFWEPPVSTTGMRTGPRAGCSSGFLRRGSTYIYYIISIVDVVEWMVVGVDVFIWL